MIRSIKVCLSKRGLQVAALLLAPMLLPQPGTSAPSDDAWAKHHEDMGRRFFARQDYGRSIEEWERATLLYGSAVPPSLQVALARGYYLHGDYSNSQAVLGARLGSWFAEPCSGTAELVSLCLQARLLMAECLCQMGAYTSAANLLDDLVAQERGRAPAVGTAAARPHQTAAVLLGYALANQGESTGAHRAFDAVASDPGHPYRQLATAARQAMTEHEHEKPYSPPLAAALSLIPGLGQVYTGHYGVALASLLVNGILFYYTHDAWDKARQIPHYSYAAAAGWGALSLTFYSANLYSANQLARQRNLDRDQQLTRRLRQLGFDNLFGAAAQ